MVKENWGSAYQKLISILFAGLLATTGLIWNNSQKQIENSLARIEKLMEIINSMQREMSNLNYQIEMLQYRINSIDEKIDDISPYENNSQLPSRPRLERK